MYYRGLRFLGPLLRGPSCLDTWRSCRLAVVFFRNEVAASEREHGGMVGATVVRGGPRGGGP